MRSFAFYVAAELAEIAGCFAFRAWLWAVEGTRSDRWDLIGVAICLVGAGIILFGPRAA